MAVGGQSRLQSLIERCSDAVVGILLSWAATPHILRLFGFESDQAAVNLGIVLCFTIISIARGYVVRRLFNWLHVWQASRER